MAKTDGSVFQSWTVVGRLLLTGYHGQRLVTLSGDSQCRVSMKIVSGHVVKTGPHGLCTPVAVGVKAMHMVR